MKPRFHRWLDKLLVAPFVAVVGRLRRRSAPPASSSTAPPTVVAIKLVGMGDAVLLLPACAAIRKSARLVVVTTGRCAGIFGAPGVADELVVLGRRGVLRQLRAQVRALRGCHAVLDFEQHVYWSAAAALLARSSALRLGFRTASRARNRAYHRLVEPGAAPRPMKQIFDELAAAAGFPPVANLLPLPLRPASEARCAAWLQSEGLVPGAYIALAPGSGATVAFRRLPAATWAEVIAGLPDIYSVVLLGSRADAPLLAEIASLAGSRTHLQLGFNLEELASALRQARLVLATDSGPMHLAAAMGAPVVGVFGPDSPRRYAPPPPSRSVTLNLPCSPCNNCWVYREARCTNPDAFACIRRLPAARVLAAVSELLCSDVAFGDPSPADRPHDHGQHHRP